MKTRSRLFLLTVSAIVSLAAHHASAQLINIDARVSGAFPDSHFVNWHSPISPVSVTLAAGTYDFTLTNPQLMPGALYTAWTPNNSWITSYLVFDSTNLSQQLFAGAPSTQGSPTAQAAFNATVAAGEAVTTWTFTNQVTLLFTAIDFILSDNAGGISVDITPAAGVPSEPPPVGAVPEPSTYGVVAAVALLGIGLVRRRANDRRTALTAG